MRGAAGAVAKLVLSQLNQVVAWVSQVGSLLDTNAPEAFSLSWSTTTRFDVPIHRACHYFVKQSSKQEQKDTIGGQIGFAVAMFAGLGARV